MGMEKSARGADLRQGELITLAALAARTVGANGATFELHGERIKHVIINQITASATDAADTLDVYVDTSFDNVTWFNVVHFTQQAGNGVARTETVVLEPLGIAATVVNVTADAAAGAVRSGLVGPYFRARWAIVDAGGAGDQSHTFSVLMYAMS